METYIQHAEKVTSWLNTHKTSITVINYEDILNKPEKTIKLVMTDMDIPFPKNITTECDSSERACLTLHLPPTLASKIENFKEFCNEVERGHREQVTLFPNPNPDL